MKNQVLFICTGNYYRSRFAEYLFNHLVTQNGMTDQWQATSRGLMIELIQPEDGPLSLHTTNALLARRIEREPVRHPIALTVDDLESSRHVIALKRTEHQPMMQRKFPDWEHRIDYWQVDDIDVAHPKDALPMIERLVNEMIGNLSKA